jgi:hypothetical protein
MHFAALLANATFDRWSEAFSGGFAKGAIIGVIIWGVFKLLGGGK